MNPRRHPHGRRTAHRTTLLAVGALLTFPLAACADNSDAAGDDGSASSTTDLWTAGPANDPGPIDAPPEGDSTDPATGEDLRDACEQYVGVSAMLSGTLDPAEAEPVLDAFAADPPSRLSDAAPLIAAGLRATLDGDHGAFEDPEFVSALGTTGSYLFERCELDARLDVVGDDYVFVGISDVVKAGQVGIRLANASLGNEPHELILMRRPAGDLRTVDEIVELGPEALFGEYAMVGVAWADVPSATMSILVDLEPGAYLAICTLPVGEDAETLHLHAGMIQAFTVR